MNAGGKKAVLWGTALDNLASCILLELGEPEPRFTEVAWGPLPEFEAFMPGIPATPKLTCETAGPVSGWRGLVGEPRRTGVGFAS